MVDHHKDRGQALPWMMLVVFVACALVVVAVRVAIVVDDAARVRTAADAAALAGAAEGEAAASALAERNGGVLVSFERTGRGVRVVVQVGDVRARAEASGSVVWVRPD